MMKEDLPIATFATPASMRDLCLVHHFTSTGMLISQAVKLAPPAACARAISALNHLPDMLTDEPCVR